MELKQDEYTDGTNNEVIRKTQLERRVVLKQDLFIMPVVMILYIMSYLDRSNVGNAKIMGLPEDLNLTGSQFNVLASIFYVTYITLDIPMTLAVHKFGPRKVLPTIAVLWSIVTIFSGFATSYASMIVIRLLIGITQAGLFPGLNFYISILYKREELSKRISLIFISLALSGAFGGLLAYAISQMDGVCGKASWRWLFIIEGAASFLIALSCYGLLPDSAATAYFLTQEEKKAAENRLKEQEQNEDETRVEVVSALKSIPNWISGILQLGANTYLFGFSLFLPEIIYQMGYKQLHVQYLVIPVYLLGGILYFIISFLADNRKVRFFDLMMGATIPIYVGYIILLIGGINDIPKKGVLYFATFCISAGGYIIPGLNMTWISSNVKSNCQRATALGINQTLGNIGGIISGQIYRDNDAPDFVIGHSTSLGGLTLAGISAMALYWIFRAYNRPSPLPTVTNNNEENRRLFVYRL